MTWFKVDDAFPRHTKVRALRSFGPRVMADAIALWTLAGCNCAASLGDGGVVDGLVSDADVVAIMSPATPAAARAAANALVSVGLWEKRGEGYLFHDWAEYQPTSEEVSKEKKRWKESKRKSRGCPADVPAGHVRESAEVSTACPETPVPVPVPTTFGSDLAIAPPDPDPPPLGRVLNGFRERWDRRYAAQWRPTDANLKAARQRADEYAERPEKLAETLDGFFATDDAFVLGKRHPFALWSNDPERWIPGKKPQEPPISIEEHTAKRRAEIAANNARRYGGSA